MEKAKSGKARPETADRGTHQPMEKQLERTRENISHRQSIAPRRRANTGFARTLSTSGKPINCTRLHSSIKSIGQRFRHGLEQTFGTLAILTQNHTDQS